MSAPLLCLRLKLVGWLSSRELTLFAACVEFEHLALRHTYAESCLRWFRGKLHQFVFLEFFHEGINYKRNYSASRAAAELHGFELLDSLRPL